MKSTYTDRDGRIKLTVVDPVANTTTEKWYAAGDTGLVTVLLTTLDSRGRFVKPRKRFGVMKPHDGQSALPDDRCRQFTNYELGRLG